MKAFFVLILFLAASAFAQVPDAPSHVRTQLPPKPENIWTAPMKHPEFYVGVGVFSAAAWADVHSTKVCEANHACFEAYKGHDSYGYIAPQIALVAGMTYGCEIMLHEHKWWRRFVCPGIGIGLSIQHWQDASNIYPSNEKAKP